MHAHQSWWAWPLQFQRYCYFQIWPSFPFEPYSSLCLRTPTQKHYYWLMPLMLTLRNILHLCPSLGRVLINTYRDGAHLYIDGKSITSTERTTQSAMVMYALGANPLIETMGTVNEARRVWFADDCTTSESVLQLSHWWHALLTHGPRYGYHPNASKATLLVKPEYVENANHLFKDIDIKIVSDGSHVLCAPYWFYLLCPLLDQGQSPILGR